MKLAGFLSTILVQQGRDLTESTDSNNNQTLKTLHNDLMSTTNTNKKLNIVAEMILVSTRG